MAYVIGEGLRVGRGAGATAPDVVVELGDLVRGAVGDVRASGDAGVCDGAGGEEVTCGAFGADKKTVPRRHSPAQRTTPPSNCTAMIVVPDDSSPGLR